MTVLFPTARACGEPMAQAAALALTIRRKPRVQAETPAPPVLLPRSAGRSLGKGTSLQEQLWLLREPSLISGFPKGSAW